MLMDFRKMIKLMFYVFIGSMVLQYFVSGAFTKYVVISAVGAAICFIIILILKNIDSKNAGNQPANSNSKKK